MPLFYRRSLTVMYYRGIYSAQVFPLLVQQFSSKEQSLLIWQFICSIPVVLLEDLLPWMTSFLSQEEQIDVVHCLKQITPDEKLLQEVDPY